MKILIYTSQIARRMETMLYSFQRVFPLSLSVESGVDSLPNNM